MIFFIYKTISDSYSIHTMTFNPSHYPTKQSLLEEIQKAFKSVNLICRQYFSKVNDVPEKIPLQKNHYRNFNNYKGLNDITPGTALISENHNLIQKNQQNISEQSFHTLSDNVSSSSQKRPKSQLNPVYLSQKPVQNYQNSNDLKKYTNIKKPLSGQSIPPPPKPPLSPYFTFYKQKKDLIKKEFPDMSITQLAQTTAKVWKSLTEQQKGPYNRRYFEEKRDYEKAINEYAAKYPNYRQVLKKGAAGNTKK